MADLEQQVKDAQAAGERMMRTELKGGVKVFYHPLRFKVSEAWICIPRIGNLLGKWDHQ